MLKYQPGRQRRAADFLIIAALGRCHVFGKSATNIFPAAQKRGWADSALIDLLVRMGMRH